MKGKKKKKKVVLALSGGVDSTVAALLLIGMGYDVVAAFMKNWSDSRTVKGSCSWQEERRDAIAVAAKLKIPITTFDFEKEYRANVLQYMFCEYEKGNTPNPDVFCNSEVKFPLFWQEAKKLGADFIATGHHVKKTGSKKSGWKLLAGIDDNKDQSYFLHRLSQEDLEHTLFPIGDYTKDEVREIARTYDLPTADKRSTRGLCFIGKVKIPEFLGQAIDEKPGPIQTREGKIVGEHKGLPFYTIGQRHGFGTGGGSAYYVVAKEPSTNTLIVGGKEDIGLYRSEINLKEIHWISGKEPKLPIKIEARIRYRSPLFKAQLLKDENKNIKIEFDEPVRAPARGQFAVFYKGRECLGGGVIE